VTELRTAFKISIFLAILTVDLIFFIVLREYFPDGHDGVIATASYLTGISLDIIRPLFVIVGFAVVLICVSVIFYFIYDLVKKASKSLEIGGN
jgi:hypothetical protein